MIIVLNQYQIDEIISIYARVEVHNKLNLHAAKRLCNKIGEYEAEDYFWYWYKVYDRELEYKECITIHKESSLLRKILFINNTATYYFKYCLFHKYLLDKTTRYFTDPLASLRSILYTILLFTISYCSPFVYLNFSFTVDRDY
jgi:hypothetical protein